MRYLVLSIFYFTIHILSTQVAAQGCNGAVSATVNPKEYCFEGNPISVLLNGVVTGQACDIFWTPEDNLDNPKALKPTATITAPGMYMYTIHAIMKNSTSGNLIVNGGFESGNTGFSSDYSYVDPTPNSLWTEGNYTVLNAGQTPRNVHDNFATCGPHGGSRMMVANGNAGLNTKVWCQAVPVSANTGYILTGYGTSVHSESPAILQFSINGENIGNPLSLSSSTCNPWSQFSACWLSETSTIAEVCIVNLNTALSGNDFAIDDISLTRAQIDSCKVSFKVVEPVHKNKVVSICKGDKYTLGTSTFQETGFYENIHVKGPGPCDTIYDLDLTVVEMISSIIDTVGLSCLQPTLKLTGDVILNNNLYQNLTHFWTASNGGNIVSGGNTLTPTINQGGKYLLTTTYRQNGLICKDTVSIQIFNDTIKPKVNILPEKDTLNCLKSIITLNATVNANNNPFSINWKTLQNGHIVSGDTTLFPVVDSAGLYILTIKNLKNGCVGLDTSNIKKDKVIPIVDVNIPDTLSCSKDSVNLFTTLQDYSKYSYNWKTFNGFLDNNINQHSVWAKGPGRYTLTVENMFNKCKDSISVEVLSDKNIPVAFIEPPNYLTCSTKQIILDGSKSSSGNNITHSWSTLNGSFISGDTTIKPTVNLQGNYKLTITNTANGCIKTYSVDVQWDTLKPFVSIAPPLELSCITTSVDIVGNGSANGNPIHYKWSTQNGQIVGLDTTSKITASKTGTYSLLVTNLTNGCTELQSVVVKNDTTKPVAIINSTDTLTCSVNQIVVNAGSSSKGNRYIYSWNTISGNIQTGNNSLSPTVNQPGIYQLFVQDTILGCKDSSQIAVFQNLTKPKADIIPPLTVNCKDTSVLVSGVNSTAQSNTLGYFWKSSNSGALTDTTSSIFVTNADQITLIVKDKNNGCIDSTQVTVDKNIVKPLASIDTGLVITCKNPVLTIGSKIIQNQGNILYNWYTSNGSIVGSNSSPNITIDKEGTYFLEIEDLANHCKQLISAPVSKNIVLPSVSIVPPKILNCKDTIVDMDGSASSSGTDFTYLWKTTNGNLLENSSLNKNSTKIPAIYTLVVTNEKTGCKDSVNVSVQQDVQKPSVSILPPTEINCLQKIVSVDGSNSSSGINYVYEWTTKAGSIVGNNSSNKINVDEPGFYVLKITNTTNSCHTVDSVFVSKSADVPIAAIQKPDTLTCSKTSISIDGTKSSIGGAFSLQWSASGGGIIQGNSTGSTITTVLPGTYTLIVTNTTNNCKDTNSVQVSQNILKPTSIASATDTINCKKAQIQLNGSLSNASKINYNWFTTNGNIISGKNNAITIVSKAGQYSLEITDLTNDCKDTSSVNVIDDFQKPTFNIVSPDTLSCKKNQATVSTNSNTAYSFSWSGAGIQSGQNTNLIQVSQSGTYKLVVTQLRNGCKDSSSIFVSEDFVKPTINIQSPQVVSCKLKTVSLDGTGSSTGTNIQYLWTTSNGNIIGNPTDIIVSTNQSGDYKLLITNTKNGCQSDKAITIQQDTIKPVVLIPTPKEITCTSKTVSLSANSNTNFSFVWATTNGNILGNSSQSVISVDKSGQYQVTVTNPVNGCSQTGSAFVSDNIVYPLADAGNDLMLNCKTNKAILSGKENNIGNFAYSWKTVQGSTVGVLKSITISNTGSYVYIVKNLETGCEKSDTVVVRQNKPTNMEISVFSPPCGQERGYADVKNVTGGTPPYQFLYGNLVTPGDSHIEHLLPGNYTITVVDANQCTFAKDIIVKEPKGFELQVITKDVDVTLGDSVQLEVDVNVPKARIDTLIWTPSNNLNLSNIWKPWTKPLDIARYIIVAIDSNQCKDTAEIWVGIRYPDVYIPNAFSPHNSDGHNDIFMIYAHENSQIKVNYLEIFDRWGNQVFGIRNFLPNDERYGWNGGFNGKLMAPAVFVYVTEIEYLNGKKKILKGDITLFGN